MRGPRLREALETLRSGTDFAARVAQDPIAFPRRFSDPADIEIAAVLAASLAYGRVPLFSAALERILKAMGGRPRAFVDNFDVSRDMKALAPLYYRMHRAEDIGALLYLLGQVRRRYGSLGGLFKLGWRDDDADVGPALDRFVDALSAIDLSPVCGRDVRPYGLALFLSRPSKGSACKRLNMLLRWMVRPFDGVDFGLWDFVPPSKLVVPLDTHILRLSRYLGLTRRRSGGWVTAAEVTRRLAEIAPEDPLRYDFPLCHHGISGRCPLARVPDACRACPLLGECAKGRALVQPGRNGDVTVR